MLCIMPYDLILQTVLHFLYIFCKRELQKDDVFNNVEETFKLIVAENKHWTLGFRKIEIQYSKESVLLNSMYDFIQNSD
jgi:hypothetical protein